MDLRRRIEILGIPVDHVDMAEAVRVFDGLMAGKGTALIVTPNSEIIVKASKDKELAEIIASADLVIPDGIGLVYASGLKGRPLKERVTGIDFLNCVLDRLEQNGRSVFLLGGEPGVADEAAKKMKKTFPDLKVAGTRHGFFSAGEEQKLAEDINRSNADFLCVALGSPKQEKFMNRHRESLTVKAAIGVGGSLDVWAGKVKRAPAFYRHHGLEWLYRLIKQPARYKRMAALPVFMIRVLLSERGALK